MEFTTTPAKAVPPTGQAPHAQHLSGAKGAVSAFYPVFPSSACSLPCLPYGKAHLSHPRLQVPKGRDHLTVEFGLASTVFCRLSPPLPQTEPFLKAEVFIEECGLVVPLQKQGGLTVLGLCRKD